MTIALLKTFEKVEKDKILAKKDENLRFKFLIFVDSF
jgi:hypothetical protein